MTRTENRLTDALSAAARAVPEETLRPLITPPAGMVSVSTFVPVFSRAASNSEIGARQQRQQPREQVARFHGP